MFYENIKIKKTKPLTKKLISSTLDDSLFIIIEGELC